MDPSIFVHCPCTDGAVSPETAPVTFPETLQDQNCVFDPRDLYYCPQCALVKCNRCTEPEIVSRYCPSCMTVATTDLRECVRSCFGCPLCLATLVVKASTAPNGNRSYRFGCDGCLYTYTQQTETERLKAPLATYVKASANANHPHHRLYQALKEQLHLKVEVETNKLLLRLPADLRSKNSVVDVVAVPVPWPETYSPSQPFQESIPQKLDRQETHSQNLRCLYPTPQRLRTKRAVVCKLCRQTLVKPAREPAKIKFLQASYLHDVLPTIYVTLPSDRSFTLTTLPLDNSATISTFNKDSATGDSSVYSLSLSFVNNSRHRAKVTLAVRPVQAYRLATPAETIMVEATVPMPHFTLGPRPEKLNHPNLTLATIPTPSLTTLTSLARVEAMHRGAVEHDERAEVGTNWFCLTLKLAVSTAKDPTGAWPLSSLKELTLPVYVTVESEAAAFGCWCLLPVGRCLDAVA